MTSYNDFLSAIPFYTPDVNVNSKIVERLDKNNIPELMLTEEQRQEYVAELLWAINDGRDVGYLKSQRVDLWDAFVDKNSAIYGDYTPEQRLALYGNEELAKLFAEFIGDYIKDEPTEGYEPVYDAVVNEEAAQRLDENGVRVPTEPKIKHYAHLELNDIGHTWLDRQEVRGAPKELILGEVLSAWRQQGLRQGLDRFNGAVQGEWVELPKKMPFGDGKVVVFKALKRPIDKDTLQEMLRDARITGDVNDPALAEVLSNFPNIEFELYVKAEHLTLAELDIVIFQASILGQMLANSYRVVATTLNVDVIDCVMREDEVNTKLNTLAEEQHNASHVFLPARYASWLEYTPLSFQFM